MGQGDDAVRDASQVSVGAYCPSSWFPPPDLTVSTCQVGEASLWLCIIGALGTEGASHLWVFWAAWLRQWEPQNVHVIKNTSVQRLAWTHEGRHLGEAFRVI